MSEVKLMVFYPQPTDPAQFEKDYVEHLKLFHEKMGLPLDARPYTVTRFLPGPDGLPPYYQAFIFPFPSIEALLQAKASPELQEIAADAVRISSGGAPVVLAGGEVDPLV